MKRWIAVAVMALGACGNEQASSESDVQDVRGLYIGQSRLNAKLTLTERGMLPVREDDSEDIIYDDTSLCRNELQHDHSNEDIRVNAIGRTCQWFGNIYYNSEGQVIKFRLAREFFNLDELNTREFARTLLEQYNMSEMEQSSSSRSLWGVTTTCEKYSGIWGSVKVDVSSGGCGYVGAPFADFQASPLISGDFD